jgi:hypothetical protein
MSGKPFHGTRGFEIQYLEANPAIRDLIARQEAATAGKLISAEDILTRQAKAFGVSLEQLKRKEKIKDET